MEINSASFQNGQPIPEKYCFGRIDPDTHVTLSDNMNPHLLWTGAPEGTRSFVLLCMDPDVPSVGDDVNKEGRSVSRDLPRCDFCHWVMVDIPADCHEIKEGACSSGVTAGGKSDPPGPSGSRQGITNYTDWFAGDPDMQGNYHGYDGPCPPWNDERLHRYHFILHALDVEKCSIDGMDFRSEDVLSAIEGHVLDSATLIGTCSLNPDVLAES